MHIKNTFELVLTLDAEKFQKILTEAYGTVEQLNEDEYIDHSLASKGITVTYRDSKYKKKVKLIVNPAWILDCDEPDYNIPKAIRKLEKRIDDYFDFKYKLEDFNLAGMVLTTDIDVGCHEKVIEYLKVLQRIGKVKGFSPPDDSWLGDEISFCLDGNSNGIEFMIYDLKGLLIEQLRKTEAKRKKMKSIIEKSEGLLQAEVRLTEPKAIRAYTDENTASAQIAVLLKKSEKVFLDTFMRIVPFGDFHKKDKAAEIIRREVKDNTIKRRMLRLLELIPEKKSLLLAQKALNYRRVDDVMDMFSDIEVSPVTISKRHDIKKLDNLYNYL